jgi:hypothetical protein
MTESRIALLSSLACLALVVWLVIRPAPSAPMAPQAGAAPSFVTDAQVAAQLQELAARIEALQAQLAGQTVSRAEVPEAAAAAAATKLGSLAPLQEDLRALQFAVQALADAQAEASGGGVSHRLAELQREFPSMHWDACESLLQAALAAPDAREVSYLKSDNSPALAALLMLRPRDVLHRFGSPSQTQIDNGRFVWIYRSPQRDGEGRPERTMELTFDKGYVWDVRTDVSGS